MWIGNIETIEACNLVSKQDVEQMKCFFRENDIQKLPCGTYKLAENNFVNVFEYDTKENNGLYEAHKKYVDIHYVIDGEECVFYAEKFSQIKQSYDEVKDYYLGIVNDAKNLCLSGEKMVVFDIDEPHKAGVLLDNSSYVRKAVFKIEVKKSVKP